MGAIERITVAMSAEMAEALRQSVQDGEYASEGEIIRDALNDWARARGDDPADSERLRQAVKEADESGPPIPAVDVWAEMETLIAGYERRQ